MLTVILITFYVLDDGVVCTSSLMINIFKCDHNCHLLTNYDFPYCIVHLVKITKSRSPCHCEHSVAIS